MRFQSISSPLVLATAVIGVLGACSTFEPDYYNCDSRVTSYAEGVRSSLTTQNTGQDVEVRLNGVSGKCYDDGTSYVAELAIGLKVSRNVGEGGGVDPVVVPMVAAIIDADDAVQSTSSFVYTMQFTSGVQDIYPLVRREFSVPQGGRVILSLTPVLLSQ